MKIQHNNLTEKKNHPLVVRISKTERSILDKSAKTEGYDNISAFIRALIQQKTTNKSLESQNKSKKGRESKHKS